MSINDFNALVSDLELLVHELKTNVDFGFESNKYEKDPAVDIKGADFLLFMVEGAMNGLTLLDKSLGEYIEAEWDNKGNNGKREGEK